MTVKLTFSDYHSMIARLVENDILDVVDLLHELADNGSIVVKKSELNEAPW